LKRKTRDPKLRRLAQIALAVGICVILLHAGMIARADKLIEAQTATPLLVGIDHIPVVVADLEKAQADFRAMGFAIKPGRPHADGIQNAHVKFPDGTEIELITAPRAVDELTSEYRGKLKSGEGPVYFGVYAPESAALAARLSAIHAVTEKDGSLIGFPPGSPLHPLFFGQRNKAPNDRPEHFAHANTAVRLAALWVQDTPALRSLLVQLDVPITAARTCSPVMAGIGTGVGLPEGDLYLVPSATASVLAARVEVKSLVSAKAVLTRNGVPVSSDSGCNASAVWVSPANAHGIWLEFVETKKAATTTTTTS
jgi:hypothetical protein